MPEAPDLHDADALTLRAAGLTPADAETVLACRPLFEWGELAWLPEAALVALRERFTLPHLHYRDATTGETYGFAVDPRRLVLKHPERRPEVIMALAEEGYPCIRKARRGGAHALYAQGDGSPTAWPALKRRALHLLSPALRRSDLPEGWWYLDGKYVVAQLVDGATASAADEVAKALGLVVARRFRSRGLVQYLLPVARRCPGGVSRVIAALLAHRAVRFAEPSFLALDDTDAEGTSPQPGAPTQWHLDSVGARAAWTKTRGSKDVRVAIVDSGIDASHPDLAPALWGSGSADLDFSGAKTPSIADEQGHGTFIAGLVAGQGGAGAQGIAPGCSIVALKVPLDGGREDYPSRRDAILHVAEMARGNRIVLNLSWKTSCDTVVIREAIERVVAAGALVVASAGNSPRGAEEPHFPSDYPAVISVAAVGADLRRASYSFWGRQIDLAAPGGTPGEDDRLSLSSSVPGGGIACACGTSFAAPQVAAVAALAWSIHPELDASAVRRLVEESAERLTDPGLGAGLVRADVAVGVPRPETPAPSSAALVGPPGDAPAAAPVAGFDVLAVVNDLSAEALQTRFGLRALTARMLVMKRPFAAKDDLDFLLRIAPDDHARLVGAPTSDAEVIGDAVVRSNPFIALLRGLDWEHDLDEPFRLFRAYEAEQDRRLGAAFDRFAAAHVGGSAGALLRALPPDARAEIVGAPTIRHLLLAERPTDLRSLVVAVDAAACVAGLLPAAPRTLWTAGAAIGLPRGAKADALPAARQAFAWPGPDGIYMAPRLDGGPVIDLSALDGDGREVLGRRFPFPEDRANAIVAALGEAWDALRAVPAARGLVARVLRVLAIVHDAARPKRWSASSVETWIGRAKLDNPHLADDGAATLADTLVHESIHTLIYGMETSVPFIDATTYERGAVGTSGWSGRALHLHAFFHACFVWYGLWCFWDAMITSGPFAPERARRLRDEARRGFVDATSRGEYQRLRPQLQPAAREAIDHLFGVLAPARLAR